VNARRWLDRLFLAVGLGLMVWVVARQPLGALAQACAKLGPGVAVTLVVALGWHSCYAAAQRILYAGRIRWRTLLWARLAAEGYNSLFVGVGGEPFRIRYLSRFVPSGEVAATVIRDRVLDPSIGYVFSAAFLIVGSARFALPAALRGSLLVYAGVTSILGLAGMLLVLTPLPGRIGGAILRALGRPPTESPQPLPLGTLLRLLPWYVGGKVLGLVEIAVLLWILGLDHSVARVGFIDGALNAAGTLAFPLPQAVGVYEGTSLYLFELFGFPGPAGVAFGLVRRARMLVISFTGVALHWLGRDWADENETA